MKIALVTHRFPPDAVSGVERYTQMLATELRRIGDDVTVITRRPTDAREEPKIQRETLADGTVVYRLCGGSAAGDGTPAAAAVHHARLERLYTMILLERTPDVLHVNHLIDHSPRIMQIASRLRTAVVLTLHDFYMSCPRIILQKPSGEQCAGPRGGRECASTCFAGSATCAGSLSLRAMYFRRLLAVPQYVLCPSHFVADYFRRRGVNAGRIFAVPNGIAGAHGAAGAGARSGDPPLRLVFLGSVVRHKGVHVVIEAVERARLEECILDVHGPGDSKYIGELRRQAERVPGLQLRLHGPYEPDDLPSLLAGADCLVAPSQWPETFLLVAREALACGVPVIVSRLGALPEAVRDGENGFSFDHDRPEQLAGILHRLAHEPELREHLRAGAARTAVLRSDEHAALVRAYYRKAIIDAARGGGPSPADAEELTYLYSALNQPALPTPETATV